MKILSFLLAIIIPCALSSCDTPGGQAALNTGIAIAQSPATQQIVSILAQAGINSLVASGTQNWTPAEQSLRQVATAAAATDLSSAALSGIAYGLRTLQGRSGTAAVAGPVASTLVDAGATGKLAAAVSAAVPVIANSITNNDAGAGNVANEAAAAILDAAAKQKAS